MKPRLLLSNDDGLDSPFLPSFAKALAQVADLKIDHYFDEICGMDNIYAHGKTSLAERWRSEHPDAKTLLIGDTDHDFEVACAMGADCVLYSGGHQSRAQFASLDCPVVDSLLAVKCFL